MKKTNNLTTKEHVIVQIKKRKHWNWKTYLVICGIFLLVIIMSGMIQKADSAQVPNELKKEQNQVRITFTGDIQVSDRVRKLANHIGYKKLLAGMSTYWNTSDCVISNVSGPVLRTKVKNYKSTREPDEESNFIRPAAVRGFKEAGIDILSFANDDVYNYGITGITSTIEVMKEQQMNYLGVISGRKEAMHHIVEYDKKDTISAQEQVDVKQIAIISINDEIRNKSTVTESHAGIVNSSLNNLYSDIYQLSQECEYTVAYVHFSGESKNKISQEQRMIARAVIDAGADVVIGSNASMQMIEEYHEGLIFYGLGPLVSDEVYSAVVEGALLDLVVDETGMMTAYLTPTRLKNGQCEVTKNGLYQKRICSVLTKELEKSRYSVSDTGVISIKLVQ